MAQKMKRPAAEGHQTAGPLRKLTEDSISQESHQHQCPICGRTFWTDYPNMWVYRRGSFWFHTWSCMRAFDRSIKEAEEAVEKRKEKVNNGSRVELARRLAEAMEAGTSPKDFLTQLGYKHPDAQLHVIRQAVRITDPELYERIKPTGKRTPPKKPETPESVIIDGKEFTPFVPDYIPVPVISVDTDHRPETTEIWAPVQYEDLTVRAVEGKSGTLYHRQILKTGDWLDAQFPDDSDTISMTIDNWKIFLAELKHAAACLGVEL